MERAMLGVSLRDEIRNEEIRRRTRFNDEAQRVAKLKWQWAGHIACRTDGRWGLKLRWRPRTRKRSVGSAPMRWTDDIRRVAGSRCGPGPCNVKLPTKYQYQAVDVNWLK
ncbi:jg14011 [Pararge aegeria aegeria]|uniref:Jg14011 protein n=1 Tax=Pararge aegeria aegeria TaxID=348720 RepID=A0A8S4R3M4_9NEOP|nr:jg14011 [Pararge aegeria aegeria]